MRIDVPGRVRNVALPSSKPLQPLFEAIVNAIQAIEDAAQKDGRIDITVLRADDQVFDNALSDITGFRVQDAGIGFTEDNYQSFQTSDTTYKAQRGGKGIGRFVWLKAFDKVEVESHYMADGKRMCRRFAFVAAGDGVKDHSNATSQESANRTCVSLLGFKNPYRAQCPKKAETVAAYIIEHCLEYFIRAYCPQVYLLDKSGGQTLVLNDIFSQHMVANSKNIAFKVGDSNFDMTHVRLYSAHVKEHLVHYCADDRVVKSEKLAGRIPNLARFLTDADGQNFIYASYVQADLLNTTVNSERTDFTIAEDTGDLLASEITWAKIREAVAQECQKYLAPYTEPIGAKKKERVDRFVQTDAPMYRPILKHISDTMDMIDPEINDNDLDLQLYEAYHGLQVKLKAEGQQLLDDDNHNQDGFDEYTAKLQEYFSKVADVNQADLARYVCHRRAVLDFLHKQLSRKADGKYPLEDRVHNIIFPMGTTSADVLPNEHNLWLLDEKLVYHKFLASDKQLRTLQPLANGSKKAPDIIVFDKACAFAPATEPPFQAIVIIEFKRAMRDDYTGEDNPFTQVLEYITEIRAGKARTPDGRDVPVQKDIPFYCYIVCDLNQKLEEQAYYCELTKTPDGMGFFGYKRQYNAYIEVMSYTKMVTDTKRRNAVLFDKLGLPSKIG
jgi:hypothetical protein